MFLKQCFIHIKHIGISFFGKSQVLTIMWWNGFLLKKSCVKLQFFFNCCFFCGVLHFGVCFFFGPSTCFALLIPFLSVKKLNDLKKVIPIKLETQLYLLILSLSTWGYFYAHCCLRLLIFSCIYLIYIYFPLVLFLRCMTNVFNQGFGLKKMRVEVLLF